MRYWSMCDYLATAVIPLVVNPLPDGATDYGCRDDAQTAARGAGACLAGAS